MIFARVGGSGPPLLLLHGYPQTHLMWHAAAPRLAERFTVVAADLPGYGASFRPAPAPDHAPHAKRALAADQVQAMAALGHERFAVAGSRPWRARRLPDGARSPDRVSAVAVFDVVPTGEVWARADARLALVYWHWAFLAQPAPLPERLIAGDPDAFFDLHVRALGLGRAPDRYPAELMTAYRALLDDPGTVEAICEDYRAGRRRSTASTTTPTAASGGSSARCWRCGARRRPAAPVRRRAGGLAPVGPTVTGRGLDASHFLVEDRPEDVADELTPSCPHSIPPDRRPAHVLRRHRRPQPRDDLAGKLKRTELQHVPSSIPGREIVQVLTEIPAGVESGWHQHPGEEVGYIVAGHGADGDRGASPRSP